MQTRLRAILASAAVLSPVQALAEVCDKVVGEHWRPSDGPVRSVFDPPAWIVPPFEDLPTLRPSISLLIFIGIPLVFVFAAIALRALSAGYPTLLAATLLKWASYAGLALMATGACFALPTIIAPDEILLAASREGCIVLQSDWLGRSIEIGVVAGFVLLYVWTAFRMRRAERVAKARYRAEAMS